MVKVDGKASIEKHSNDNCEKINYNFIIKSSITESIIIKKVKGKICVYIIYNTYEIIYFNSLDFYFPQLEVRVCTFNEA